MKFFCLYMLFVMSIIILSGCGSPILLETPEVEKGFSIKAKYSVSLVKREVDYGCSGDPWVVPQWGLTLHPVWSSGSKMEVGMNLGIAARLSKDEIRQGEILGMVPMPVIEVTIKRKLGNTTAIVGVLPMIPPIIPTGIRAYLVKSYVMSSGTFYGSLFLDGKIASASDFDIGDGGPDARPSIGYGVLLGFSAFEETSHRILAEIGFGIYKARYENAWTGPIETRFHPFLGVGMGF